jgi:hypothetical protein
MFDHVRRIGLVLLLGIVAVAPARADGPGPNFKLQADDTIKSPDQRLRVEQYFRDKGDDGLLFRFWIFDNTHRHGFPLNADEGTDLAGYAAGFRFSPDSQWLVRMQKLGAGYHTLFLYRRHRDHFSSATRKPLGDLAWDYFFTQPASKGMHRDPKDPYSLDHMQVNLLKGMEENYASLGQHWPDSRYVAISLSFDIQGQDQPTPWIEDWRCVYDLQTGAFSVPESFAEDNATAVKTPDSDRK